MQLQPRPANRPLQPAPTTRKFSLADVRSEAPDLPNRQLFFAVEGFGKTSIMAQAPSPIFLMSKGETGLLTLMRNGVIRPTAHLPELDIWQDALAAVQFLIDEEHSYKNVVVDTISGLEKIFHTLIVKRDYAGSWDKFLAYGKGPEVAAAEWKELLHLLDKLREKRRMGIFLLSHAKVASFKNPEGPDYDRYNLDMSKPGAEVTKQWADLVFFGNFSSTVKGGDEEKGTRGKGYGGSSRIIHTQRCAAFDAKERSNLQPEIDCGGNAAEAWANIHNALTDARKEQVNG